MRRWNLLFLVALLATVLITPRGALAATSSSTSFKGRAVAKNTNTHYFVVSFTCSTGTLSAGWTYEISSTQSFTGTGTLERPPGSPGCALVSLEEGAHWSTSSDSGISVGPLPNIPLVLVVGGKNETVGMLTLFLTDVRASKTFFPYTTNLTCSSSSSNSPCIQVDTSGLMSSLGVPDFLSEDPAFPSSYATLNLSVH
jgi:hypothetical protein